jgi:Flp pilus assembly protein TadG
MKQAVTARLGRDDGMIAAFVVVAIVGLFALVGFALDEGLAFAAKLRAVGQAEQAARAGAQQIDLTAYRTNGTLRLRPAAAVTAAQDYLNADHATGTATVNGDTVVVHVTALYDTQLLGIAGIHTITVHATGTATPHRGITTTQP